jgi:imidazole glycerol-phosphate synthase subunit HisF
MRIIARLDIKNEFVIKGINFEGLRKIGNPNQIAKKLYDDGVDEIIYNDCVASLYQRNSLEKIVEETAQDIFVPLTVSGGIRSEKDAKLLMKNGADKLAINSALFKNKELAKLLIQKYGSQSIMLSIQAKKVAKNSWEAYTNFGRDKTNIDVIEWIKEMAGYNFGELLVTSIDADGTSNGFDIELYENICRHINVPIIAGGGFGKLNHITELRKYAQVDAITISKALLYKKIRIKEIKKFTIINE